MRAREVMTSPVVTVRAGAAIKEVAGLLVERAISAVPVVDDDGVLIGIVTEGDLIGLERGSDPRRHEIRQRYSEEDVPSTASEIMTADVIATHEDADVAEVARIMVERRIKQIPIVRDGRVVGIVTRHDLLRVLARDDDAIRSELQGLLDDEIEMVGRFEARVSGGVALLVGSDEQPGRHLAELLARSVPGVIGVRFEAAA